MSIEEISNDITRIQTDLAFLPTGWSERKLAAYTKRLRDRLRAQEARLKAAKNANNLSEWKLGGRD